MSGLPEGWAEAPLGDLAAREVSTVDPAKFPEQDFELYSVPSFSLGAPEDVKGAQIGSTKQRVEPGDVLLCKIVPHLNRVWTVSDVGDGEQIASGEWIVYRDHGCDPDYLRLLLSEESFRNAFMQTVSGVGGSLMRARPSAVQEIVVPIAPKAEQRRIVAKIDALTARSKRARTELERVERIATAARDAVLDSAIGPDWTKATINDVARVVTGSTPPTAERERFYGGDVPFVKPSDLDLGYVRGARESLTDAGAACSRAVPAGSTLVTCIGATIGKTGFATVDCVTNQQINALVPDRTRVEPEWLYWCTVSPRFKRTILENASATTLPIINKGRFQQLGVSVPPLPEQRVIVARIEAAFARIDAVAAEAARAAALLDRLDQAVLARAFRGELVPQDPADEPASALLARLAATRDSAPKPSRRGRRPAA